MKQAAFLDSRDPIRGFVAGQGSGKSVVGAYDLLQRALPGRTYMVTGPTYPVLSQSTVRTFLDVARDRGRLVRVRRSTDDPSALIRIHPARGPGLADVLFRSTLNPDRLRGPNLSGVWMDEASLSPHESFQILMARLREGGGAGWLSATFTPKGLSHWTYDIFGKNAPGRFLIHAATHENPFVAAEFIENVQSVYSGLRAEQELEGRFVAVEGAEWPPEYFPESIWQPLSAWPTHWKCSALALDPALSEGERGKPPPANRPPKPGCYAAFVFVGVDVQNTLWVDAWMSQQWDANALVNLGLDLVRQTGANAFSIETNGGQAFLARMFFDEARRRNTVIPLYGIENWEDKEVRIRSKLNPFLAQGRLRFRADSPGARLLVNQLRDFPVGEFKDGPDALQMSVVMADWLLGNRPTGAQPRAVR